MPSAGVHLVFLILLFIDFGIADETTTAAAPDPSNKQICDKKQYPTFEEADRTDFVNFHNERRAEIARGEASNYNGKLPAAKNMYKLKYDCRMEKKLQEELEKCDRTQFTFTNGYGQNIAKFSKDIFGNMGEKEMRNMVIKVAMESWYKPVHYIGITKPYNVYEDARLSTFANMVFSKVLRFGCGYKECKGDLYVSCIYNLIGAYPGNQLYEKGTKCRKHAQCTTYAGSTCEKATGLCKYSGPIPRPGQNTMCKGNKGMTDQPRLKVLEYHNIKRSLLARGLVQNGKNSKSSDKKNLPQASYMPKMVYDCETEAEAITYAETCLFTKSPEGDRPRYGENVYKFPIPNADAISGFEAATESWWSQIAADSINNDLKFTESLKTKAIDQRAFTQMAWAKSVNLGCAIQTCSQSSFIVCRYAPAGNILNETIYPPGQVCAGCLAACNKDEGLCNPY
ncbi:SCP-like protein [Oesophagostomum dentatum]|uniref:SCP-like protein n=1 Tax=Oesophagostomum dentatum TaxID=61180 RepID=A0A0B1TGW2_OESDE|nr:SCP-like protein [Oesophagostomum dentatum]